MVMSIKDLRYERLMDVLTVAPHAHTNGVRTRRLDLRPKSRASRLLLKIWAPETSQTYVYCTAYPGPQCCLTIVGAPSEVPTWRPYSSLLVCFHQHCGGSFRICYTSGVSPFIHDLVYRPALR